MSPRSVLTFLALLLTVLAFAPASASAQAPSDEQNNPYYDDGTGGWDDDDNYDEDWGDDGRSDNGGYDDNDYVPSVQPQQPAPAPYEPEVPYEPVLPTTNETIVKGKVAKLRTDGKAAIPRGAPKRVRNLIRAANQIVGKKYKWGGGHAKLVDTGYDCSGSVSYALIKAGFQRSPVVSGTFARMYAAGAGKYVSIYANKGHVYMEVAGLRLDTSATGDPRGNKGVRWRPVIGKRSGFKARHPVGL